MALSRIDLLMVVDSGYGALIGRRFARVLTESECFAVGLWPFSTARTVASLIIAISPSVLFGAGLRLDGNCSCGVDSYYRSPG